MRADCRGLGIDRCLPLSQKWPEPVSQHRRLASLQLSACRLACYRQSSGKYSHSSEASSSSPQRSFAGQHLESLGSRLVIFQLGCELIDQPERRGRRCPTNRLAQLFSPCWCPDRRLSVWTGGARCADGANAEGSYQSCRRDWRQRRGIGLRSTFVPQQHLIGAVMHQDMQVLCSHLGHEGKCGDLQLATLECMTLKFCRSLR